MKIQVVLTTALLLTQLAGPFAQTTFAATPAAPEAPTETPVTRVFSGVDKMAIAKSKIFYYTGTPPCPPALAASVASADGAAAVTATYTETIQRIGTKADEVRVVYAKGNLTCSGNTVLSNIAADDTYLYWVAPQGLVRLSQNANPGDAPEVLLADTNTNKTLIYADTRDVLILDWSSGITGLYYYSKIGQGKGLAAIAGPADPARLSSSNGPTGTYYQYWLIDGTLYRRTNLGTITQIATGVKDYFAQGYTGVRDDVSISFGNTMRRYNNLTNTLGAVFYKAPGSDTVQEIVQIGALLSSTFFFEIHFEPCAPSPCFGGTNTYTLKRRSAALGGGTSNDVLYTIADPAATLFVSGLTVADDYVFWRESVGGGNGRVLRLPINAAALPNTNMRITGLSITQGIQRGDNSVTLIQNKRTFVRVFAQSDGPSVPAVTMRLYRINDDGGIISGGLLPVNPTGANLTVWTAALQSRNNLNDSFLFELPWEWTTSGPLYLRATLNPFRVPPQASYANTVLNSGPFAFEASSRLHVQFVAFQYYFGNTLYTPRFIDDIMQTYSFIRRTYPLNGTSGSSTDPSPGFRPGLWFSSDDGLAARVNQSSPECQKEPYWNRKDGLDFRNLCAAAYTNAQMRAMRTEHTPASSVLMYGMAANGTDKGTSYFFRGQAESGNVSSGPTQVNAGWDTDSTNADFYAAHEIGHTLGRGHPTLKAANGGSVAMTTTLAANNCSDYDGTADGGDRGYPWAYANIGGDTNTEGFDAGDPSFKLPFRVYNQPTWKDFMSYCNNQWIGDYTYEGIRTFLRNRPAAAQLLNRANVSPQSVQAAGDWVSVEGYINEDGSGAQLSRVRRISDVAEIPGRVDGDYAIQLTDGSATLATYPFTPDDAHDLHALSFAHVVTTVAGTTQINIVRVADGVVLASKALSPNAPAISNVALQNAPDPVSGTVTLAWTASDADAGDQNALMFDVFYSRDAGATVQPVRLGITGTSTALDTSTLPGGAGHFQVVATDGTRTASANSAPITLAAKPPLPRILSPEADAHKVYGQLINFSGEGLDWQDGSVSDANLVWTTQRGPLGTGRLFSVEALAAGINVITLTATNSAGLTASTRITVFVDDDLSDIGSTLMASPDSFAFTFGGNAEVAQTQTLQVVNVAGTGMEWSATSNVPWLTLSAASGNADRSDVVLTANPAGLANGDYTGQITLTNTSSTPAQVVVVPVSLSINNNAYNPVNFSNNNGNPNPPGNLKLYMPTLQR